MNLAFLLFIQLLLIYRYANENFLTEFWSITIWQEYTGLTDYVEALNLMQKIHSRIAKGVSDEMVWMLQHPPVYTGGTSATKMIY